MHGAFCSDLQRLGMLSFDALRACRLVGLAERDLGPRFDIRAFHGTVLSNGAVPFGVLEQLVTRWVEGQRK